MAQQTIFNHAEQELLIQRLTLAYAHASLALADFLDGFIGLTIPSLTIYDASQLQAFLQQRCSGNNIFAKQSFHGIFGGETMLFAQASALQKVLKSLHANQKHSTTQQEIFLELINILNATLVRRLAQDMGTEVTFLIPSIEKSSHLSERLDCISQSYTQVIVIPTVFECEEGQLNFEVSILTKDDSIAWIHDTVTSLQDNETLHD